jgi:hypothetical protein
MALKTRDGELSYARFTDESCTLIRAEWTREDGSMHTSHHTYDPENPDVKNILGEYSAQDLEKEWSEWNKREVTTREYFDYFQEHAVAICDIIDNGRHHEAGTNIVEKPINLQSIKELGNNAEEFFKLKLEIFELDEVKNSKNRRWKAQMRKATTSLELLSLLYEVYSTLENEEGERQD